jgi:hypothetical protein
MVDSLPRDLGIEAMENKVWAIYSKENDTPIWIGDSSADLLKSMGELNRSLGNKFYMDIYRRKENETTNK